MESTNSRKARNRISIWSHFLKSIPDHLEFIWISSQINLDNGCCSFALFIVSGINIPSGDGSNSQILFICDCHCNYFSITHDCLLSAGNIVLHMLACMQNWDYASNVRLGQKSSLQINRFVLEMGVTANRVHIINYLWRCMLACHLNLDVFQFVELRYTCKFISHGN